MSKDKRSFIIVISIVGTLFLISVIAMIITLYNKHKLDDKFDEYNTQELNISLETYSCVKNNQYIYVNYDLYDGYNIPKVVYVLADEIQANNLYQGEYEVSVYWEDSTEVDYLIEYESGELWFIYEEKLNGLTYALQYFGQLD